MSNNKNKVDLSIIVPIYNVESYIYECLCSIYTGTLSKFEVICVDDCGTDNSIKIVKQFVKDNNIVNLKIINHEKNLGLSEARNTGLANSLGKYICFLDSDDKIDSKCLKKAVREALKNDLDIIEGNYLEIFETDISITTNNLNNKEEKGIMTGDQYYCDVCFNNNYTPMVWSRLYKRDYLISNNLKFVSGLKFEDEEFTPRALINAKSIKYVNYPFYIYRRRDDSITTNMMKNNNWVNHYLTIIESLNSFAKTIEYQKSYQFLMNRIADITLSLYKNPIAYGCSTENIKEIVKMVKSKKMYKYCQKSFKLSIKIQGYIMMSWNAFKIIYSLALKVGKK